MFWDEVLAFFSLFSVSTSFLKLRLGGKKEKKKCGVTVCHSKLVEKGLLVS